MNRTLIRLLPPALAILATACGSDTESSGGGDSADYPRSGATLSVIVPYDAGGPMDTLARITAPFLEDELDVTVQVMNRPGAGSQVGNTEVANAESDGYTIGLTSLPAVQTSYLDPERGAEFTREDLTPVALLSRETFVAVARSDSPFDSLTDVVDAAKSSPGEVSTGTTGLLGANHLAALEFQREADVEISAVHFEGGAPATAALLGGQVDINFDGLGTVLSQVEAGELKALAVLGEEPAPSLPDVPTAGEQGYDVVSGTGRGFIVPGGTPDSVVATLEAAVQQVAENPDFVKQAEEANLTIEYLDSVGFTDYWDTTEEQVQAALDERAS